MEERNDWEKLNNIINEYEPDPDLAHRVIEKINQRESTVEFKKSRNKQAVLALGIIGLIIAVFLAIFLPLYLTRNSVRIVLYGEEDIEVSTISDIDSFVLDNSINIEYFSDSTARNKNAKIKSTGSIAYIMQDYICDSDNGDFDVLNLKVVVMKNAEFDFYNAFNNNNSFVDIEKVRVDYDINSVSNQNVVHAKFNYQNNSYFLEIKTNDSGTNVIEKYVTMLIGE